MLEAPAYAAGPTIQTDYVYRNDSPTATFTSEAAAINDLVTRQTKAISPCSAFVSMQGDWALTGYPVVYVEGIEAVGQKSVFIGYYVGGKCDLLRGNPGVYISRSRIVCSSIQKFDAGACHSYSLETKPGADPANRGSGTSNVGDPINTATGNMWKVQRDYAAAAPSSGLLLERTYNSYYPAGDAPQGAFGANWSYSYGNRLTRQAVVPAGSPYITCILLDNNKELCPAPLPDTAPLPAAVAVYRPDGKLPVFNRVGLTWVGASNSGDRVVPVLSADNTNVLAWDFFTADGDTTERYDFNGALLIITQRNGRIQHLTYSDGTVNDTAVARYPATAPACTIVDPEQLLPAGRLLCVTDDWGRQLQFKYDSAGRIVEAIDPDMRSTLYEYDGPSGGCVAGMPAAACAANNLTKVTYPDGKSVSYLYNEAARVNNGGVCSVSGQPTHLSPGLRDV